MRGPSANADKPFLRVLITNVWLEGRGGTESVTRDLALNLQARGHFPVVYSPLIGTSGEELRARGVPVVDDVRQIAEPPDVIHGQHLPPSVEAIVRFPQVPVVNVCHAWSFGVEAPVAFPQVQYHVGVDEACRDRILTSAGGDPRRVRIIPNAVDLARIPERSVPPAERPRTALAFAKGAAEAATIERACAAAGIALVSLGASVGRLVENPEAELVKHDLVFATARGALEALCAGCAVILCDQRGMAGLVTSRNFQIYRRHNFGLRCLLNPVTEARLVGEISAYDLADAMETTRIARSEANLQNHLDLYVELYREAIDCAERNPWNAAAHSQAVSTFLRLVIPRRNVDLWPREMTAEQPSVSLDAVLARLTDFQNQLQTATLAQQRLLTAERAVADERDLLAKQIADADNRAQAVDVEYKQLRAQHNQLCLERNQLRIEHTQLRVEHTQLREVEQAVTQERDALLATRDYLATQAALSRAERETLAVRLQGAQARLSDLQAQVKRLEGEHRATISERDVLLASTSWRLTRPVRTLGRFLKRAKP